MPAKMTRQFDIGGVLLAQPFKIRRLGHFGFNDIKKWKRSTPT